MSMVEKHLGAVHTKFKLNFYRQIFGHFAEREATLTAIETVCVEVIHALKSPTVNEFAEFLRISQANAAYKVGKLVEKGYVKKVQSEKDKREFHVEVTDKFLEYYNLSSSFLKTMAARIEQRFASDDLDKLNEILEVISDELMPEVALRKNEYRF